MVVATEMRDDAVPRRSTLALDNWIGPVAHIDPESHWRYRLSSVLRPYAGMLTLGALALMAFPIVDSLMRWRLLGLSTRKAGALSLTVGLLWYIIVAPDLYGSSPVPKGNPPSPGGSS